MNKHLLEHSFSRTLKGVLSDYGITNYKLAKRSGLDPAHVSRLVSGKRKRPRAKTVLKLTMTLARLGISDSDISRVQESAGFDSFDGALGTPAVETRRRPVRRRRVNSKVVDPADITFDTDTTPPPQGDKRLEPRSVKPAKLNMGSKDDIRKFLDDLGRSAIVLPEVKAG